MQHCRKQLRCTGHSDTFGVVWTHRGLLKTDLDALGSRYWTLGLSMPLVSGAICCAATYRSVLLQTRMQQGSARLRARALVCLTVVCLLAAACAYHAVASKFAPHVARVRAGRDSAQARIPHAQRGPQSKTFPGLEGFNCTIWEELLSRFCKLDRVWIL